MIHIAAEDTRDFAQVALPARFFLKEMPELDESSLRTYLYVQARLASGDSKLEEREIALDLNLTPEKLANIFKLLEARGLIKWQSQGFVLTDLQRFYREPREASTLSLRQQPRAREEELNTLIAQINSTFYQGVMSLAFYNSIEKWFYDYHFTPEVIYALFNELKYYEKLQVHGYAEQIAANWQEQHIQSFADLNAFHESKNKLQKSASILHKKLRWQEPFSTYQMEYLKRWLEEWELDFALVDEAFRRASLKQKQANFNYVEGILKNWQEADLKNLEEVAAYEAAHRSKQAADYPASRKERAKGAMANFQQRDYSEEEVAELYRSLDFLEDESANDLADKSANEEDL